MNTIIFFITGKWNKNGTDNNFQNELSHFIECTYFRFLKYISLFLEFKDELGFLYNASTNICIQVASMKVDELKKAIEL